MKVVIRTDSSTLIGSGHVMRCLTLADQLRTEGCEVSFISRRLPGNFLRMVQVRGYAVHVLPEPEGKLSDDSWLGVDWQTDASQTAEALSLSEEPVDWLVVDHYALDARWESRLRTHVGSIMVIDDLANRSHQCDLILDQNYYEEPSARYYGLVPANCLRLLGPRYALLRPEFEAARVRRLRRSGEIRRVLIFFGGVDRTNETAKAIEAVMFASEQGVAIDVVIGASNEHSDDLEAMTALLPTGRLFRQVDNMAEMMSNADLAIGAGGTTTWERAYLGLPSITIVIADNQTESTRALDDIGAVWNLGSAAHVTVEDIRRAVRFALMNPHSVKLSGQRSRLIFGSDEYYGVKQVVRTIMEASHVTA